MAKPKCKSLGGASEYRFQMVYTIELDALPATGTPIAELLKHKG